MGKPPLSIRPNSPPERRRAGQATPIALALALLVVCISLLTYGLGSWQTPANTVTESRRTLCETLAFSVAAAGQRQDIGAISTMIESTASRRDDVRSVLILDADDTIIATGRADNVIQNRTNASGNASSSHVVEIPIHTGSQLWGKLRIQFVDAPNSVTGSLQHPLTPALALLGAGSFLLFRIYIGRALKTLDRSTVIQ